MTCTCYPLSIEGCPPNWNPDCAEHGEQSEWFNSPDQIAKREAQSERLRDLQRQARDARNRHYTRRAAVLPLPAVIDFEDS